MANGCFLTNFLTCSPLFNSVHTVICKTVQSGAASLYTYAGINVYFVLHRHKRFFFVYCFMSNVCTLDRYCHCVELLLCGIVRN